MNCSPKSTENGNLRYILAYLKGIYPAGWSKSQCGNIISQWYQHISTFFCEKINHEKQEEKGVYIYIYSSIPSTMSVYLSQWYSSTYRKTFFPANQEEEEAIGYILAYVQWCLYIISTGLMLSHKTREREREMKGIPCHGGLQTRRRPWKHLLMGIHGIQDYKTLWIGFGPNRCHHHRWICERGGQRWAEHREPYW